MGYGEKERDSTHTQHTLSLTHMKTEKHMTGASGTEPFPRNAHEDSGESYDMLGEKRMEPTSAPRPFAKYRKDAVSSTRSTPR